jgi:hypothetical protein
MSFINFSSTSIFLKRIIPITITTMLFMISGDLPAQSNQFITGRKYLEMYLKYITQQGGGGTGYWCSESEEVASTLFTPTQYKILGNELGDHKNYFATVTIHSSNQGGSPIVKNWRFWIKKGESILEREMKKDGSSSSSINHWRKKTGGWCIRYIGEN